MRILLATDGSEHSEAAEQVLLARPWPTDSVFRVINVVNTLYPLGVSYFPEPPELEMNFKRMTLARVEEAKKVVERVADALRASGLFVETNVRRGDPRVEIIDEAQDFGADLVVVGSHGRTGLKRWVLGSVAEYVVRHAPCSVEVVRTPKKPSVEQTSLSP